jgi:secondary thiamine-phosphate synthase enzyme
MPIIYQLIEVKTESGIHLYNLTPQLLEILKTTAIKQGQILVFARHTTTALVINENEERLLEDLRVHLKKLAPPEDKYLHNDLHLRDVPPDEPIHLMAMMLSTSKEIGCREWGVGSGKMGRQGRQGEI